MSMVSAVRRLQLSDTGVSCGVSPKCKLLQHHNIRFAISAWVGLHPHASPTIPATSILPDIGVRIIDVSNN